MNCLWSNDLALMVMTMLPTVCMIDKSHWFEALAHIAFWWIMHIKFSRLGRFGCIGATKLLKLPIIVGVLSVVVDTSFSTATGNSENVQLLCSSTDWIKQLQYIAAYNCNLCYNYYRRNIFKFQSAVLSFILNNENFIIFCSQTNNTVVSEVRWSWFTVVNSCVRRIFSFDTVII